jgi:hypothetical protein
MVLPVALTSQNFCEALSLYSKRVLAILNRINSKLKIQENKV